MVMPATSPGRWPISSRNFSAATVPGAAFAFSKACQRTRISWSFRVRVLPLPSRWGFLTPSIGLLASRALSQAQPNSFTSTERNRLAEMGERATTSTGAAPRPGY